MNHDAFEWLLVNPFISEDSEVDTLIVNLNMFTDAKGGFSLKSKNGMVNSVDPDETARYEPSHLDLHCLHMYLSWSDGLEELKSVMIMMIINQFIVQ